MLFVIVIVVMVVASLTFFFLLLLLLLQVFFFSCMLQCYSNEDTVEYVNTQLNIECLYSIKRQSTF